MQDPISSGFWKQPYNWQNEHDQLRKMLLEKFSELSNTKRLIHDLFEGKTQIRCTAEGCKVRYSIPDIDSWDLSKFGTTLELFSTLHQTHQIRHLFPRIRERTNCLSLVSYSGRWDTDSTYFHLCTLCHQTMPFPMPGDDTRSWSHVCHKNWILDLGKPNTMQWVSSAWVLQINFEKSLWKALDDHQHGKFDPKNTCFLINDILADDAEVYCKAAFPNFRKLPKPAPRPASNLQISRKTKAAGDFIDCLPLDLVMKVRKLIRMELHPDRNPNGLKTLQAFEEAFNRWEKEGK